MVRVCESNIIFPCVHRPSICLSRVFSLTTWRNSIKLASSFLLVVKVCESKIILPCVRPCALVRTSVLHAISSQNTGRGCGNSTKLAASLPLMVRMCESNIIFPCASPSVRLGSVHLSVRLSPPKPFSRI